MFDSREQVGAFIAAFEVRRVPKAQWTHEAHLVAGFWYVWHLGAEGALNELRTRIRLHNETVGTANTDHSGYHETITRLYVAGIAKHISRCSGLSFEDGLKNLLASPLSSSHWPLTFYTSERLFSVRARREWVEPEFGSAE